MEEKPNYYAVIPAEVRYDKELKDKAKLLYGEITSLSDKFGYCYASNKYFANLYEVDLSTISRLIKNLVDRGYIKTTLIYKEGTKEVKSRYMQICKGGYMQNCKEGICKIAKDNNTSINNNKEINNINIIYKEKNFKKPTLEEVEEYCKERNNNINAQKFIDFYESKGWKVGKTPMKDWKACIRTWEGNNTNKPTKVVNELPERLSKDTETNEMTKEERDELDFLLGEITK